MSRFRFILILTAFLSFLGQAEAQDNALGTSWSLTGIGFSYERSINERTFVHTGIRLESGEVFIGRHTRPGGSVSFTWNTILSSWESSEGNRICFFAGPGATIGYCKDLEINRDENNQEGTFFGMQGRAGIAIEYPRNISIKICVAPVLGMHLTKGDEYNMMRYYRYGLLQTILPEINISYRF